MRCHPNLLSLASTLGRVFNGMSLLLFFTDKDVEIGWLDYILSIDIGFLFPALGFCFHSNITAFIVSS